MALRGARILLAGACTRTGQSLVEAFLALGAEVIAADRLRTRLEELRARVHQHERLWVAEADLSGPSTALALFADVARDEPIDAAIFIVPGGENDDSCGGQLDSHVRAEQAAALPVRQCEALLGAASEAMRGHGRVLVVLEPAVGGDSALTTALQQLVERHAGRAHSVGVGPSVGGLLAVGSHGALLERVAVLCDPGRPAAHGWQDP